MKQQKKNYGEIIDSVRSTHRANVPSANVTVDCPRCGTRQVISESPGSRFCLKCGFEFRPLNQRTDRKIV